MLVVINVDTFDCMFSVEMEMGMFVLLVLNVLLRRCKVGFSAVIKLVCTSDEYSGERPT